jgi:hypothetical protein
MARESSVRSLILRMLLFDAAVLLSAAVSFHLFPAPIAKWIAALYHAILVTPCVWFSFQIYRSLKEGRRARRIWALLTAALGSWAIGEILWAAITTFTTPPDFGWLDLFWLIGNAFLIAFYASLIRFFSLAIRGWRQFLAFGLILLFIVTAGVAIYAPMFRKLLENWLGFAISLLYQIQYFLLLAGATLLTLAVYQGLLGISWTVLAAGIWLHAFSDQVFFYTSLQGLYYPKGEATALSVFHDLVYIASYLIILNGVYLRRALPLPAVVAEEVRMIAPQLRPRETWVLISDENGRVLFADPRLLQVTGADSVGEVVGEFVGALLGLQSKTELEILGEARAQGYSRPRAVLLFGERYAVQAVVEERSLREVYWLLTPGDVGLAIRHEEKISLEGLLAQAVRGTVRAPGELQAAYFRAVFQLISVMCARFGGEEIGQRFFQQFEPSLNDGLEKMRLDPLHGAKACRDRLQRALEWALVVVPADQLGDALKRLEEGLGEEVLRAVDAAGLRLALPGG